MLVLPGLETGSGHSLVVLGRGSESPSQGSGSESTTHPPPCTVSPVSGGYCVLSTVKVGQAKLRCSVGQVYDRHF